MKRKLTLLNLALVALLGATLWRISIVRQEAEVRRQAVLGQATARAPVAPLPEVKPPEPVSAINYIDIADLLLFSADRNPMVQIEAAPPKPLPPLPVLHGVLDIGSGPTAILSMNANDPQLGYQVGDEIGGLVLVELTPNQLTFQFEDRLVSRTADELKPVVKVEAKRATAPTPPKPKPQSATKTLAGSASLAGPSEMGMGGGIRACQAGDTSPPGTVTGGYRKVVSKTPFGEACRWEPME